MVKERLSIMFSKASIIILKIASRLPLNVLYLFCNISYLLVYHIFRYRRKYVYMNLSNSFPDKSNKEIKKTAQDFYRYFCELIAEVIKLQTISFSELRRRCVFTPESTTVLNRFYQEGKSIMIVMGHVGNWEWAGASWPLSQKHNVITAYKPLKNKLFDDLTLHVRERTGNTLASMRAIPKELYRNINRIKAVALISDQTPSPEHAYWINFLNQETPFFKGPELISKKYNMSVFWGSVMRTKKGHYSIDIKLIAENPNSEEFSREGTLTKLHASYLERDILSLPETWLWTHRRWKHSRPAAEQLI